MSAPNRRDGGFTIIEVVVALLVLTVGLLAFAGSTTFVIRQVTAARVLTERSAAMQATVEHLRTLQYEAVITSEQPRAEGAYAVTWIVEPLGRTKTIRVVAVGPGPQGRGGQVIRNASDTLVFQIIEP